MAPNDDDFDESKPDTISFLRDALEDDDDDDDGFGFGGGGGEEEVEEAPEQTVPNVQEALAAEDAEPPPSDATIIDFKIDAEEREKLKRLHEEAVREEEEQAAAEEAGEAEAEVEEEPVRSQDTLVQQLPDAEAPAATPPPPAPEVSYESYDSYEDEEEEKGGGLGKSVGIAAGIAALVAVAGWIVLGGGEDTGTAPPDKPPVAGPATTPDPKVEPEPDPEVATTPKPEPEPDPEVAATPEPEPKPEPQPNLPVPEVEVATTPEPEPEPEPTPEVTPEPTVTADPAKLAELEALADERFKKLSYSIPADKNAIVYYRQILELDPGHSLARERLDRIKDFFLDRAATAGAKDDLENVLFNVNKALLTAPGDPDLLQRAQQVQDLIDARASEAAGGGGETEGEGGEDEG